MPQLSATPVLPQLPARTGRRLRRAVCRALHGAIRNSAPAAVRYSTLGALFLCIPAINFAQRQQGTPAASPAQIQSSAPARTLSGSWQHIRAQLASGEHAAALSELDALQQNFGSEPELLAALPDLLPLYADLCMAHNRADDAARLYRQWLALPQTQALRPQRITVLAALANACESASDTAGMLAALQELIATAPPRDARRDFARLRLAGALYHTAGTQAALDALQTLLQEAEYPLPLQIRARLQAVYLALESGSDPIAAELLLAGEWYSAQMPELAQLSFAAQRIYAYLLAEENPLQALQALDLVTATPELLHLQRLRRMDVANALRLQQSRQQAGLLEAGAAVQFLAAQLAEIDRQLSYLEAQPQTRTPVLYMRANALLQAGRPWQAAILFAATQEYAQHEAQSADAATEAALRETSLLAQYNRLLALHSARRTQKLLTHAEAFANEHTSHPLTLRARVLQAESLLQEKRYADALRLLDTLLPALPERTPADNANAPAPPLAANATATTNTSTTSTAAAATANTSATATPANAVAAAHAAATAADTSAQTAQLHFYRGYANAFLAKYADAQADFLCAASTAEQPLLDSARYWAGQSDMLAGNYPQARTRFAEMLPSMDAQHPAFAYATFSYAQALYASGSFPQALDALGTFLHQWPQHERSGNARLLLAETQIALLQKQVALNTLQALQADAADPWAGQAAVRQGEILEQMQRPAEAIAVYTAYLQTAAEPTAATVRQGGSSRSANSREAHARTFPEAYVSALNNAVRTYLSVRQNSKAAGLLTTALAEQGNNPAHGDFGAIIALAFRLGLNPQAPHMRPASAAGEAAGNDLKPEPFASLGNAAQKNAAMPYSLWLQQARQAALNTGKATLYARLSLELSRHYTRSNQTDLQEAVLLQIAAYTQPADLDNAALEAVAIHLAALDHSTAQSYLDALQERNSANTQEPPALLWAQALIALHQQEYRQANDLLARLNADWPTHPLRTEALATQAQLAHQSGDAEAARQHWLTLLGTRGTPPALRTQALLALARQHAGAGDTAAAINYYQRIYTLYRAHTQEAVSAYMESAPLFEAMGDRTAALATFEELLGSTDLPLSPAQRTQAQSQHQLLLETTEAQLHPAQENSTVQFLLTTEPQTLPMPQQKDDLAASRLADSEARNEPADNRGTLPQPIPANQSASLPAMADIAHLTAPSILPAASLPQAPPSLASDSQWHRLLQTPARVLLVYGGTLTGDVIGIEGDQLHLRLRQGGTGIGETTLPLENIRSIDFGDDALWDYIDHLNADGHGERAYQCATELYLRRQGTLAFAGIATLNRFAHLAEQALERGEPLLSIRIASRILTTRTEQAARTEPHSALEVRLLDAQLLGLWQLGLHKQAAAKAGEICAITLPISAATYTPPASALPHALLAAQSLAAADADAALELALHPVSLHSGKARTQLPHIGTAYMLAIEAAEALRQPATAQQLRDEAQAQGIPPATFWPHSPP